MEKNVLRVAMAQVLPQADIAATIASAARMDADVVVFPEMFSNGYSRFDPASDASRVTWIEAAVALDSAYVRQFQTAAQKEGIAVVATFLERGDPRPFNAAVLIDGRGAIVLHQRKRHICHFDIPEEVCAAGDRSEVVALPTSAGTVNVGIMICMDREFPEVASDLCRRGADIILIPNSSPLVDDPDVGDVRVAGVRAMAFQRVIGAAVANYPAPKDDGRSFAVDPLGCVISMAGGLPTIAIADFDLTQLGAMQRKEWFRRAH